MYLNSYLLFCIALLLCLGAVIAFSLFVVKPVQTRWAVRQARRIVAGGDRGSDWRFHNVHRMLATAHNDLEAMELYFELKKLSVPAIQSAPAAPVKSAKTPVKKYKPTVKAAKPAIAASTAPAARSTSRVKSN
ncbi:MAG TPA: hypothetical protein VMB24_00680 [Dehalococcoidales bacterium]|nr:hypothetical protein [Dehalococcoidales bacterium]